MCLYGSVLMFSIVVEMCVSLKDFIVHDTHKNQIFSPFVQYKYACILFYILFCILFLWHFILSESMFNQWNSQYFFYMCTSITFTIQKHNFFFFWFSFQFYCYFHFIFFHWNWLFFFIVIPIQLLHLNECWAPMYWATVKYSKLLHFYEMNLTNYDDDTLSTWSFGDNKIMVIFFYEACVLDGIVLIFILWFRKRACSEDVQFSTFSFAAKHQLRTLNYSTARKEYTRSV